MHHLRHWRRWAIATTLTGATLGLATGLVSLTATPALSGLHHDHSPKHDQATPIQVIPANEEAGIYMLMGEGGNIGVLVGKDGALLIDSQFAQLSEGIQAAVAKLGNEDIRFLLNTHWHFDHTGGNENLGNEGVMIVAHDNVRDRMSTDQTVPSISMEFPASPDVALPVMTYRDRIMFYLNEQTIEVTHVEAAHTDGDSIIHFPDANVMHLGDTYFNGFYPFIDFDSAGSLDGMIAATEQALELADDETVIIPGHGPISNKAELETYLALLQEVKVRTEAAIVTNVSLEDFVAARPFRAYDATWGSGFLKPEQFLTIVYNGLSQAD